MARTRLPSRRANESIGFLYVGVGVVPPRVAWSRLRDIEFVLAQQPAFARAVLQLTMYDQLELNLELLH